jgi:hypothetical protein
MMIAQTLLGAGIAAFAGLVALTTGSNPTHSGNVPYETDLQWMRKSIDVMPPCHFNAYGSVSASDNSSKARGGWVRLGQNDPLYSRESDKYSTEVIS